MNNVETNIFSNFQVWPSSGFDAVVVGIGCFQHRWHRKDLAYSLGLVQQRWHQIACLRHSILPSTNFTFLDSHLRLQQICRIWFVPSLRIC